MRTVKDDVHLSYLPLAHAFERTLQEAVVMNGARIGFFSGDVKLLMEDMAVLQPTILPIVPRLLNRIYDKVRLCGASGASLVESNALLRL